MKDCFLFPGQGAQYPGMGKDLWEASDGVRELFEIAADTSGTDVKKLLFEGTEDDLRATDKTQLAVTLVNLAASRFLKERGIEPSGCAGFSLGEYAALVTAAVLRPEDVFPLVKLRGIVMEKASRALDDPSGNPGMAAVIGLDPGVAAALVGETDGAFVANFNSPIQTVVAGTFAGLSALETRCKEKGAKRFIRLKVSGPFHTPLLSSARDEFAEAVDGIRFSDPVMPVYSNVTGKRIETGAEAKKRCVEQIVSPVRWIDEERLISGAGFTRCLESGPGTVLCGLWKSMVSDIPCLPAGTVQDIDKISEPE